MVGIYHTFEGNRKALIKIIGNGIDIEFEEIDHWTKIGAAASDLIVIFSPEFLPNGVTSDEFKNVIQRINKTLIIVSYNAKTWQMNRTRMFYLTNLNETKTIDHIRAIIALETIKKSTKHLNRKQIANSG